MNKEGDYIGLILGLSFKYEDAGEYESIKTAFDKRLEELEESHPDFSCTTPEFVAAAWKVVFLASTPIPDPSSTGIRNDFGKVIETARQLHSLIALEKDRMWLLGADDQIDSLAEGLVNFIEDLETSLKNMPEPKRKGGPKSWKADASISLLARRFQDHGYADKVTATDEGVFVKMAKIVLQTANQIAKENGREDSHVNISAKNIVKRIIKGRAF